MSARVKKLVIVSGIACLAALVSLPFVLTTEYLRSSSPDHRFYAVATYPIWQRFVPMMPGQSGDKAGYITVYTADGRSCGRTPVEMVSSIGDLSWSADRAEIRLVAEWDLLRYRVQRIQ